MDSRINISEPFENKNSDGKIENYNENIGKIISNPDLIQLTQKNIDPYSENFDKYQNKQMEVIY